MTQPTDHVIRAMTDDGAFRVLALRATDTVRALLDAQAVRGPTAWTLADLACAAVLVRETMAPGNRVQALYTDPGGGRLVADAHPEGLTRGLAQVGDDVLGAFVRAGGIFEVVRVMRPGKGHHGVIETHDDDSVAEALARYFLQSEQVTTMLRLGCVFEEDRVVAAGGFVVQLLPELTEPPLARMRARIDALGSIESLLVATDADPSQLLGSLVEGEIHTQLADSTVRFGCVCSQERVVASLATLGEDDLRDLLARGEELGVTCDYCRKRWVAGPDDYRRLLGS
ncbi:MAG: Hsp33 family molecular chaperone HslO [Planctomycetes bacterium]|nr:Hsp33 family molecular chaperone HslO [Planctomycetota bacterium]